MKEPELTFLEYDAIYKHAQLRVAQCRINRDRTTEEFWSKIAEKIEPAISPATAEKYRSPTRVGITEP